MSLSELWEFVMDREAWRAAIHGITKSRIRLSDWTELNESRCQDISFFFCFFFLVFSFKLAFALSSFALIKRFFRSPSLSAFRLVSSTYLRLLKFLLPILIPAYNSSSLAFLMMCSTYRLKKQGDLGILGEGGDKFCSLSPTYSHMSGVLPSGHTKPYLPSLRSLYLLFPLPRIFFLGLTCLASHVLALV